MRFELTGSVTRFYNTETYSSIELPSDLVARAFFSGGSIDLGLLPPAVRWVSADSRGIVLERPPNRYSVSYKDNIYQICVPWTIWGIRLSPKLKVNASYLFGRPYPVASPADELFAFPLPNMAKDSGIALPLKSFANVGQSLTTMISAYWARPFTGAFNEMLEDQTFVPDEWIPSVNQGIAKYFVSLGEYDLESITFAPLKTAQIPTLQDLCILLDPTAQEEDPKTALEYLERVMIRAQQQIAEF